jgi:hypothetical protein
VLYRAACVAVALFICLGLPSLQPRQKFDAYFCRRGYRLPRVRIPYLARLHSLPAKTPAVSAQAPASISAGPMGPIGLLVTVGGARTTRRYASSRLIKIAGNRLRPIGTSIGPILLKPNAS